MAADIRRGIHAGEFSLHYQAIRNIKDRSITGYEALLRWQHPQLGTIPPDVLYSHRRRERRHRALRLLGARAGV
ncbi:EAL domain-containing protein [Klebsiella pneumoniae subsp. pneumoniae]|nr:EAL domain-containing protein [Klebsiella pneumoniae subsp. pneumoniae]